MKKALGLLDIGAAAAAYAIYKISNEEPTEEEKIVHEPSNEKEISEQLLKNVEEAGFEPVEYDDKTEFTSNTFPYLTESDIIEITKDSESVFKMIENMDANEERPIQHRVAFDNEENRETFKNIAISQGYVITSGDDEDILVLNISKLDQDDILAKVFYLANLTKEHQGIYKGWIVK